MPAMRVLVVGGGSIGERHLRVLGQIGGVELAVVEPRGERRERLVREYELRAGHPAFAPSQLEGCTAVLVCTPSHQHLDVAMAGLRAGCHLFVEKPLSVSLDGIDELLAAAKAEDRIVQVGYVLRHHPNARQIHQWLTSGEIGIVRSIQYVGGYDVAQARPDYRGTYWQRKSTGGGAVWDATHQVDLCRWWLGEIDHVSCFADHLSEFETEPEVEDIAMVLYRFRRGALGSAQYNHFRRDYRSRWELVGAEGSILWDYVDSRVSIYRHADRTWEHRQWTVERDDFYRQQMRNFIAACRGEAQPLVTGEDGLAAVRVALACYRSMESGRSEMV